VDESKKSCSAASKLCEALRVVLLVQEEAEMVEVSRKVVLWRWSWGGGGKLISKALPAHSRLRAPQRPDVHPRQPCSSMQHHADVVWTREKFEVDATASGFLLEQEWGNSMVLM